MKINFDDLRKANSDRAIEWNGNRPELKDLEFCTIEFSGEAGEVADAVKKLLRHFMKIKGGVPFEKSIVDIGEELADSIICADLLAECLGIDLAEVVQRKFNLTSDKHGFKIKL